MKLSLPKACANNYTLRIAEKSFCALLYAINGKPKKEKILCIFYMP